MAKKKSIQKKKTAKKTSTQKKALKRQSTTKKKTAKKVTTAGKKTFIASRNSVHGFDNAGILELQQALIYTEAIERNASRGFSSRLIKVLENNKPSILVQKFLGTAYRAMSQGKKSFALDSQATFGAGGRVNIGMAQQDSLFQGPLSRAYSGIYCSKDKVTAEIEFQSTGPGKYELVTLEASTKTISLVEFDAVVKYLDQLLAPESLTGRVSSAPYQGAWAFQKFPLPSQLIGNWIRLHSVDVQGLFFQSTKDPTGINFFIFDPSSWKIL